MTHCHSEHTGIKSIIGAKEKIKEGMTSGPMLQNRLEKCHDEYWVWGQIVILAVGEQIPNELLDTQVPVPGSTKIEQDA